MILSMFAAVPWPVSADEPLSAVFTDGDLDNIYFIGDNLTFNLTGLPVGIPPTGIPERS